MLYLFQIKAIFVLFTVKIGGIIKSINNNGGTVMKYVNNKAEDVKIAYIGGGSRGWAWGFMSDLAVV